MKGFIDFIRKGNLVQLAVAFVMGVAFTAVITSFVSNIISPLLGLFGGTDFTDEGVCLKGNCTPTFDPVTKAVTAGDGVFLAWGAFVTALITFVTIALIVYFFVVKPYEVLEERLSKKGDEDLAPTELDLLTEIRDALVTNSGTSKPAD